MNNANSPWNIIEISGDKQPEFLPDGRIMIGPKRYPPINWLPLLSMGLSLLSIVLNLYTIWSNHH